ncbi:anti-sigma factor family protein [Croceicoccus naphthovorans]|uniref:Uncharacterized protein n=1 Tax=Croceicoccus naphthovorans TaxID=1348774 RepID=A0A0G3XFD2_9SPHN|nr:hypothetical protein [Croceicoccus naphthovorans]AKM09053.1 hypothetical protein AB433_02250 [Croceicoccus naphthovorans]MBB3991441.1 hypothetical protein [Croceicoccus naphthovorans]
MRPTPEEIAAFADGELEAVRKDEIAALVEADPELAAEVARHHALRQTLAGHFAPILDAPVPDRLSERLMEGREGVASIAAAREKRAASRRIPRWVWAAGPAIAAVLVLAVMAPRDGGTPPGYAEPQLAGLLEEGSSYDQLADADPRLLFSLKDRKGRYCRVFQGSDASGIACRDNTGWKLEADGPSDPAQQAQYRQAGSGSAALMEQAQAMADGPALDAGAEDAARAAGWQAR